MRLSTTEIRFLTLPEKVQYIRQNGLYLRTRKSNSYQIQLYQVGAYYAEIWVYTAHNKVEKVVIKDNRQG